MTGSKATGGEAISSDNDLDTLDDQKVRDYLKANSDFFERNPDLLDYLQISHSAGSAVSLVEKQVSVLRERNMEMRKRLNSLTDNARDNDRLYEQTRKLVLALVEADTHEQVGAVFQRSMLEDFGVQHASLVLFGDPANTTDTCRVEPLDAARIEIGALLKGKNAICGPLRKEELAYLFPGATAVASAAVMPLVDSAELGVIAVGSDDAGYYSSGMGTLFLTHIADVLVRLLPRLAS